MNEILSSYGGWSGSNSTVINLGDYTTSTPFNVDAPKANWSIALIIANMTYSSGVGQYSPYISTLDYNYKGIYLKGATGSLQTYAVMVFAPSEKAGSDKIRLIIREGNNTSGVYKGLNVGITTLAW